MTDRKLRWVLKARGSLEDLRSYLCGEDGSPSGFAVEGRFTPSPAIYLMDGASDATIRLRGSGEELSFSFVDENTSIAASAPLLFDRDKATHGVYVPTPKPLRPCACLPEATPARYTRDTTVHMMQVISMNMKAPGKSHRLLIGVPYAEKYPGIFYDSDLFDGQSPDGQSYGVVSSLTDNVDEVTGKKEILSNGYPARSFFAIYHILETQVGAFFNKKATQMELQPDRHGHLALNMPPLPFEYALINGPIPLFDVNDPNGEPIADLVSAHHHDGKSVEASMKPTDDAWPFHLPDLKKIQAASRDSSSKKKK